MTYSTHYQCDEASYWIPLSADLSETNFTFDTSGLPGGDRCTVRVMVTDGFNSAEALSDPFFVQSKGPIVDILTESNTFSSDERVLLRGAAMDLEDGVIPSENLHWTSNLDGELGSGSALHIPLSPGTHLVSLYAQDSDGYLSLAQATIQVQSGEILTGMGNGLHLQSLWLIGF